MGETVPGVGPARPGSASSSSSSLFKTLPGLPKLEIPSFDAPRPALIASPASTQKTWTPTDRESVPHFPQGPFGMGIKGVRPPRPISKDPPRPMTASTKRLSFSSMSSKRTIKYGMGKFASVELVPQPSDDPDDPLNWPSWRKNLNFLALIYMVALIGPMKTAFITVNSNIATANGISYTAAVALTAVPLMVSSFSGMGALIISRIYGKRPAYLVSTTLIFIGVVWSMYVMNSFGQNMAARVFQGLGWGILDALVLSSLQDTFFEHELDQRVQILNVVSVATTWGAPLLGGLASASSMGFTRQFEILSSFLALGVPLIVFGAPETAFERPTYSASSPVRAQIHAYWPYRTFSLEAAKAHLGKMKPWSFKASFVDSNTILQAPRAAVAPTTLLLFIVSLLPYAALWSFASSLSLLFSVMPFMLSTTTVGLLLTGPFIMMVAAGTALTLPAYLRRFTPEVHVGTLAGATVLASIGILGLGSYVAGCMTASSSATTTTSMFDLNSVGATTLSFPVVSFLLGLVAAGSAATDATLRPMIRRSTSFTSSSLAVGLRGAADMGAAAGCLRNLAAGALVLGIPDAVWAWDGLRAAAIGLGIAQIFVAGAAGCAWWMWEERIRRCDGRVMGLVDLGLGGAGRGGGGKTQVSFFDPS